MALLASIALIGGWLATIITAEATGPDFLIDYSARPLSYYLAHAASLLAVMLAGGLAVWRGRLRAIRGSVRVALFVLIAVAVIWAAVSYEAEELLSTTLVGATGPFVWLTLIFVLVGTDRRVWRVLDPVIVALAYATSILTVRILVDTGVSTYFLGYSKHTAYCILLMWFGGWALLNAVRLRGWRLALRATPAVLMFLTAALVQSRSWTLLSLLLCLTFLFLRGRQEGSTLKGLRNVVAAAALLVVVWVGISQVRSALEGVSSRFDADTRTVQYYDFFSVVPLTDLILGRGPTGTWYWYGIGDYQYFDNGFLWMLFIGGAPTLIAYVVIVLFPAFAALRAHPMGGDVAAVCLVMFWGLALAGLSTYSLPSVGVGSYVLSLYAGRCHLILAEAEYRRRRRSNAQARSWAPRGVLAIEPRGTTT
jgi:hypothetical protein